MSEGRIWGIGFIWDWGTRKRGFQCEASRVSGNPGMPFPVVRMTYSASLGAGWHLGAARVISSISVACSNPVADAV